MSVNIDLGVRRIIVLIHCYLVTNKEFLYLFIGDGCLYDTTLVVRFANGQVNVLVASEVLEEGIDIQKCNLIVKFDMPKNYRSYVQSKGRARFRSSKYFMMVPANDGPLFVKKCETYKATENALRTVSTIWRICTLLMLGCR
jgi:hypothetical protein